MGRKYWITTHWPPEVGDEVSYDIYLVNGLQDVGAIIKPGDRVWLYESKGGPRIIRERPDGSKYKKKRKPGREGIVAIAEVIHELHGVDVSKEKYEDGSERWWRWKADAQLVNQSGFVARMKLNTLLGYKSGNLLHGFGEKKSGLKEIDKKLYQEMLKVFNRNQPPETILGGKDPRSHPPPCGRGGGESPEHKNLKERIGHNPEEVLGEEGLVNFKIEYPFPTGDQADVILKDADNRYVAVEVELAVDLNNISGVLQAIKYSCMLAVERRRKFEEVRAFLVAHEISEDVKRLCAKYGIETFVVARE